MVTLGLIAALGALISWTLGDYLIEQTTRKIGDWKTIFFIGLGGFVGITPFVYKEIPSIFSDSSNLHVLFLLSGVSLVTALFFFEALKEGKLSVIEPICSLELIAVVILSIVVGGEKLDYIFYVLTAIMFVGIFLSVTKLQHLRFGKHWLEKGVLLAIIGAVLMGFTDFLTGFSSRLTSPLLTIWFLHVVVGFVSFVYLLFRGEVPSLARNLKENAKTIIPLMFFDNFAWVSYGYAMIFLPIAIATTLTESYIALAAFLGIYLNKEKVQRHQMIGISLVIVSALTLAYLVEY